MSRLTVVIPAIGSTSALEASLVSALEHRPAGCDVIVVLREPYADPYDLAGEVRFINAPRSADAAQCIHLGARAADSDFVFVLVAGCEVTAGWSDAALRHFANPRIAAIVPRLASAADPTQTVCQGVRLLPGGKRIVHTGSPPVGEDLFAGVWAPAIAAGFYRTAAIRSLNECSTAMGGPLADARLAAALHCNRWLVAWAPASVVLGDSAALDSQASRVHLAWHSQRLANETAGMFGGARSRRSARSVMVGEFFRTLPSPMAFVLLAVRLTASMLGAGRANVFTSAALADQAPASQKLANPSVADQSDTAAKDTLEPGIRRLDRSHSRERREQMAQSAKRA